MVDISKYLIPVEPKDCIPFLFRLHTDAAFRMGHSHQVCQDYARASKTMIALSDGCSSSPDTDFGARLNVLATEWLLNEPTYSITAQSVDIIAAHKGVPLNILPSGHRDATLLTAHKTPQGFIMVQVFGDGVVGIRRRDGSEEIYDIDQGGAPAYPSYFNDPARMKALKDAGFGGRKVTVTVNGVEKAMWEWHPDLLEKHPDFAFLVDPRDTDLIVLMSDGVHSFQNYITKEPVPSQDVIDELIGFRNTHGKFVTRRVQSFLKRSCPHFHWEHYDDLSVAAMYIEALKEPDDD